MSLFEWMGERYNPGSVGSVQFGRGGGSSRTNGVVIVRFCIAYAVIGAVYYFVFTNLCKASLENVGITTGVLSGYCLFAYFFRPEPDTSNMGWCGGVLDNPFRYSDDINRFLLGLKIILLPGVFVADSVVDICLLMRNMFRSR